MPTEPAGTAALCLVNMATGVGHCFCSLDCFRAWAEFNNWMFGRDQVRWAHQPDCIYCYRCGDLARLCPDCSLHDGDCPMHDYQHTFAAERLAHLVSQDIKRPLTDRDIAIINRVLAERKNGEDARDMVRKVHARLRRNNDASAP
jgi:hypothetical protein